MEKSRFTVGMALALIANGVCVDTAEAVYLSANGIGQALVYPYYTVNDKQQTVLSVVNSTSRAKAVKLRFREGHNGRSVLEFDLFLSPYDVWTGTVFALADAGIPGNGAAIQTQDRSCTAPAFSEEGTFLPSGNPYVAFRDFAYMTPDDGGPYTIDRTREGHFEIIARADLTGLLASAVTHNASGVPANCAIVRNLTGGESGILPPGSGLFGAVGVVNAQRGTFFGYNAEALERFTGTALYANAGSSEYPDLSAVNDGAGALASQATAVVMTPAGVTESTYPGADPRSRRIDAVSAVFAADSLYNEYQISPQVGASTDWVITYPTKAYYVDPLMIGPQAEAVPPFVHVYDGSAATGPSCTVLGHNIYSREERTIVTTGGFPGMPLVPPPTTCRQTNVLSFLELPNGTTPLTSGALGSRLITNVRPWGLQTGWLNLRLDPAAEPHALLAASNGNIHRGLPATGFSATLVTNKQASMLNSASKLPNQSSTSKHRPISECVNGKGSCD